MLTIKGKNVEGEPHSASRTKTEVDGSWTGCLSRKNLRALKFFLDKRPVQEPYTSVLVRLAELVLTLNNFSFDGEHYQQISGVAMRIKLGPNCAN